MCEHLARLGALLGAARVELVGLRHAVRLLRHEGPRHLSPPRAIGGSLPRISRDVSGLDSDLVTVPTMKHRSRVSIEHFRLSQATDSRLHHVQKKRKYQGSLDAGRGPKRARVSSRCREPAPKPQFRFAFPSLELLVTFPVRFGRWKVQPTCTCVPWLSRTLSIVQSPTPVSVPAPKHHSQSGYL